MRLLEIDQRAKVFPMASVLENEIVRFLMRHPTHAYCDGCLVQELRHHGNVNAGADVVATPKLFHSFGTCTKCRLDKFVVSAAPHPAAPPRRRR